MADLIAIEGGVTAMAISSYFRAFVPALALLMWNFAGGAQAQVPTDFLTQQVCVVSGVVTSTDPVYCTGTTRHLNIGEALPYHKIDMAHSQISDSYPVASYIPDDGHSAVQTYFFTDDINSDPRFPGMVHFNAAHGGYNILGADSSNIYYKGTFDPAGGWQPWWTSDCKAKGWLIAPSTSAALSYGSMASPTMMYPDCPGTVPVNSLSSVEWNYYQVYYAAGKQLNSIVSFHFASNGTGGSWGPLEVIYLTREYGVTRWEGWSDAANAVTPDAAKAQCPNSLYSASIHGHTYTLVDCRDWSTIITDYAPWDPAGHSPGTNPGDANALVWPVDPLYTNGNLLKNTHVGGPYSIGSSPVCSLANWGLVNSPAAINTDWDPTNLSPFNTLPVPGSTPYVATGNCTLRFWTPGPVVGGQAVYQQIAIMPGSTYPMSFGAMLWAPEYTTGTPPHITARLFQLSSTGALITYSDIDADLSSHPTTFRQSFTLNASTAYLTLTFYPWVANTKYEMTGAWIAPTQTMASP